MKKEDVISIIKKNFDEIEHYIEYKQEIAEWEQLKKIFQKIYDDIDKLC